MHCSMLKRVEVLRLGLVVVRVEVVRVDLAVEIAVVVGEVEVELLEAEMGQARHPFEVGSMEVEM